MAKLYFKYGAMGSSKTASALITKFNYEEKGMRVWLIKPSVDTRDGERILSSRIGLSAECTPISPEDSIRELFLDGHIECDVIISDESQFFTSAQINEMRQIVDEFDTPVIAFGLRCDFRTELFEASARLFALADSISEIKTICSCGRKATVNARIAADGAVITDGEQLMLGGNESYEAMCHRCYTRRMKKGV
jgi:thymidine kinase